MFERFTERARQVVVLAQEEARTLKHNYIGTEHILLGLVRENEGVAARILLDFDADSEKIRTEAIRRIPEAPTEPAGAQHSVSALAGGSSGRISDPMATPTDLGWRGRPIVLAALGSAVLARRAFAPSKIGDLESLEMQVLACLALGPPEGTSTATQDSGELLDSLEAALACEYGDLRDAVRGLTVRGLVDSREEEDGDRRITITTAGLSTVSRWLAQTTPLFGPWPPDEPAADDVTG
jgi:hypothetical protein